MQVPMDLIDIINTLSVGKLGIHVGGKYFVVHMMIVVIGFM